MKNMVTENKENRNQAFGDLLLGSGWLNSGKALLEIALEL